MRKPKDLYYLEQIDDFFTRLIYILGLRKLVALINIDCKLGTFVTVLMMGNKKLGVSWQPSKSNQFCFWNLHWD